ncbi:hypothetical protein OIU34_17810 [Pararhizobium sp. BT-229]|uniref:hypothetical protein n=1 Tax=Pararhizobium sp. BT-229 TaxID=2986923 RepID=UPI0021F6F214|nr:hypothetical protein [Pararhizobium sp. BT-229]MCV9963734.1 hypothetical protein [Pararhizobium sp. BT-229]
MSDIAKTMAERIRNAAGGSAVLPAPNKQAAQSPDSQKTVAEHNTALFDDMFTKLFGIPLSAIPEKTATPDARKQYADAAAIVFQQTYGVSLDSVTDLFVPKNDIVYANAEQGVPLEEFTRTLGSQMAFDSITGKEDDFARYVAGENQVKLALAEYAYSVDDWTFSDGYAVTDNDGSAVVVAPAYDEAINAWQFSAYSAPCDKDAFVAMSRAQKASTPSEDRVYGDIDDCVQSMFSVKAAPAAMRM